MPLVIQCGRGVQQRHLRIPNRGMATVRNLSHRDEQSASSDTRVPDKLAFASRSISLGKCTNKFGSSTRPLHTMNDNWPADTMHCFRRNPSDDEKKWVQHRGSLVWSSGKPLFAKNSQTGSIDNLGRRANHLHRLINHFRSVISNLGRDKITSGSGSRAFGEVVCVCKGGMLSDVCQSGIRY